MSGTNNPNQPNTTYHVASENVNTNNAPTAPDKTEYTFKATDPVVGNKNKNPNTKQETVPPPPEVDPGKDDKPFLYSAENSPCSTAVIRHYLAPGIWRANIMRSSSLMDSMVPAFEARLANITSARSAHGISKEQLNEAWQITKKMCDDGNKSIDIYNKLRAINPKIPDYLAKQLKIEFAVGSPASISESGDFLTSLNDHDFFQWFNQHKYESSRILHILNSTVFYEDCNLKREADDSGFSMYRSGPNGDTKLYSMHLDKAGKGASQGRITFTLQDNSTAAVIALADFISMHRQGNSNSITLTKVGDPVAFLLLVEELVAVHNMYVELPDQVVKVLNSKLENLTKSGYPEDQKKELLDRAATLIKYAREFSSSSHNELNHWLPGSAHKNAINKTRKTLSKLVATRDQIYKTPADVAAKRESDDQVVLKHKNISPNSG